MRKPTFCICEADQRLYFLYMEITIPLLPKPEISSCTAGFVSDLVGNPKDRFSHEAQIEFQL